MKHLTILTLFLWLCCGCTNEYDDNSSPEKSAFSVADAQKFFENSNTQVTDLTFSAATRAERHSLKPDWNDARITGTGDITTIEALLAGEQSSEVTVSKTSTSGVSTVTMKAIKRLVIQRKTNGDTRQFVVTMLHAGQTRSAQNDNCYGKSDFSGYILVSEVDGAYQDAFESIDGQWARQRVANLDTSSDDMTLNFEPYGFWDDELPPAPPGYIYCRNCKHLIIFDVDCNICITEDGGEIEEVEIPGWVHPNPSGNCKSCNQYPCQCHWKCIFCGSMYCNGFCQSGGGGSGGGGTSGGVAGSGAPNNCMDTSDKKVLDLLNKIDKDCMGKTLLTNLKDRKIPIVNKPGITAQYQRNYDNNGKYVGDIIYVGDQYPDVAFIEELIHAYQSRNNSNSNNGHALNDEIEGKLGWIMYLNREGVDINNYKEYLGRDAGLVAFENLYYLNEFGVSLYKDENLTYYRDYYQDIVDIFHGWGSPYSNKSKYPFSKDQMRFKSLEELMANC